MPDDSGRTSAVISDLCGDIVNNIYWPAFEDYELNGIWLNFIARGVSKKRHCHQKISTRTIFLRWTINRPQVSNEKSPKI